MSKSRTDDAPGMYYTPDHIVNPATGTGNALQPAADLANPPYHIETRTQRLARLGVELAKMTDRMFYDVPFVEAQEIAKKIRTLKDEILQLSESWEPSNE